MPIERERRATLRFAAGLALAALIGWGRGGPFAYVLPLLALLLLAPGTPPPAPRQALALLVITGLSCIWGLLLTPLLTYAPPAGVTVILAGVALSSFLAGMRPGLAVPLKLFIVGNTLIAVVAFHSQALAQFVAVQMGVDIVLAVAIAWVVAVLLPDRRDEPAPVPLPVPEPLAAPAAGWVGLRSALVMGLPVVLALQNPGLFLMTLMNGAQLAQQPDAQRLHQNALAIVTSTAAGGAMALGFWWVLGLWPALPLLVGGIALAALVAGPWLHGPAASEASRQWWPPALSTMIVVLGSTVADSDMGTDIQILTIRRIAVMLALALLAAVLVQGLDTWRTRRIARRQKTGAMG